MSPATPASPALLCFFFFLIFMTWWFSSLTVLILTFRAKKKNCLITCACLKLQAMPQEFHKVYFTWIAVLVKVIKRSPKALSRSPSGSVCGLFTFSIPKAAHFRGFPLLPAVPLLLLSWGSWRAACGPQDSVVTQALNPCAANQRLSYACALEEHWETIEVDTGLNWLECSPWDISGNCL